MVTFAVRHHSCFEGHVRSTSYFERMLSRLQTDGADLDSAAVVGIPLKRKIGY